MDILKSGSDRLRVNTSDTRRATEYMFVSEEKSRRYMNQPASSFERGDGRMIPTHAFWK
jgi:hypothetical protein